MIKSKDSSSPILTRTYAWFSALAAEDMILMDDLLIHGLPVDTAHPLRHTTALMEATRRGRTSLVQWLLTRGAAPAFLCGIPRGTPMHCAVRYHQFEVARMLLESTLQVGVLDAHSRTPLHVLSMDMPEDEPESLMGVRVARELIDKGCPLDALDDEGITALHYSVINGYSVLTQLLLERGANPNIQSPDSGVSPLAIAALEKNVPLAQILLEYGANPHLARKDGSTPVSIMPSMKRLLPELQKNAAPTQQSTAN